MMNLRSIHGATDARSMAEYFYQDVGWSLELDALLAVANDAVLEELGRHLNDGELSYEDTVSIRYDAKLNGMTGRIDHEALYRAASDEVVAAATRADFAAEGRLDAELAKIRDPAWVEQFAVRYRPDMAPRLQELLGIDSRAAPDRETVVHLLQNRDARGEKIAGKHYAERRSNGARPQAFVSVTFSAGKSVSVGYAFAIPEMKAEIRRAHQGAVETALQEMGERLGKIRLGPGGRDGRENGDVGWVSFFHTHSRQGDPQLHSHVGIFNVVASRQSDRVGSLHTNTMKGQFRHFRGVYQRALAENLVEAGLKATYDRERLEARVEGIPERVLQAFSKRREEILEQAKTVAGMESRDYDKLPRWEQIQICRKVTMATRPPKDGIEVGVKDWRVELAALNWNPSVIFNKTIEKKVAERSPKTYGLVDDRYHVGGAELEWGIER